MPWYKKLILEVRGPNGLHPLWGSWGKLFLCLFQLVEAPLPPAKLAVPVPLLSCPPLRTLESPLGLPDNQANTPHLRSLPLITPAWFLLPRKVTRSLFPAPGNHPSFLSMNSLSKPSCKWRHAVFVFL